MLKGWNAVALDIIFLMIVAVFVITRLHAVLGSRGEDKNVQIIIKPIDKKAQKDMPDNVVPMAVVDSLKATDVCSLKDNAKNMTDGHINKEACLRSARMVFEMIVQAFNSGNMADVKDLDSKKIYDAFNEVLTFRKNNNMTAEVDFICFDKSEIKEIKPMKNIIKVVV